MNIKKEGSPKKYKRNKHLKYEPGTKEYSRNASLKYMYGITLDDYNNLYVEQKGCCDICNKHQSELKAGLCVDHNHTTGKVRGLLCVNCNQAIGKLYENVEFMENAIKYILKN